MYCVVILVFVIDFGDRNLIQVEENICKFAKKGLTPSQIGVILRDSHGIAQVKSVTGSKILRILKAHGIQLFLSRMKVLNVDCGRVAFMIMSHRDAVECDRTYNHCRLLSNYDRVTL
jgi:hypothetical protein